MGKFSRTSGLEAVIDHWWLMMMPVVIFREISIKCASAENSPDLPTFSLKRNSGPLWHNHFSGLFRGELYGTFPYIYLVTSPINPLALELDLPTLIK